MEHPECFDNTRSGGDEEKKMKTKINLTEGGTVLVEYDSPFMGDRVTREFMAPAAGGYVREWVSGDWKQVCDGLSDSGSTLYLVDGGSLIEMIRKEYRAMRREWKQYGF